MCLLNVDIKVKLASEVLLPNPDLDSKAFMINLIKKCLSLKVISLYVFPTGMDNMMRYFKMIASNAVFKTVVGHIT